MTKSKKGLNPVQVQAPQSAHHDTGTTECNSNTAHQPTKRRTNNSKHPTDVEAVGLLMLERPEGITSWDAMALTLGPNGRNVPSFLERELGIGLYREKLNNTVKKGHHDKWLITCRADALKVAGRVNLERVTRNMPPLPPGEVERLASQFPDLQKTVA